jgi:hypothetical protein
LGKAINRISGGTRVDAGVDTVCRASREVLSAALVRFIKTRRARTKTNGGAVDLISTIDPAHCA